MLKYLRERLQEGPACPAVPRRVEPRDSGPDILESRELGIPGYAELSSVPNVLRCVRETV